MLMWVVCLYIHSFTLVYLGLKLSSHTNSIKQTFVALYLDMNSQILSFGILWWETRGVTPDPRGENSASWQPCWCPKSNLWKVVDFLLFCTTTGSCPQIRLKGRIQFCNIVLELPFILIVRESWYLSAMTRWRNAFSIFFPYSAYIYKWCTGVHEKLQQWRQQ